MTNTKEVKEPAKDQLTILAAINRLGMKVYEGTVTQKVIDTRRAKNRMARVSRRQNRRNK